MTEQNVDIVRDARKRERLSVATFCAVCAVAALAPQNERGLFSLGGPGASAFAATPLDAQVAQAGGGDGGGYGGRTGGAGPRRGGPGNTGGSGLGGPDDGATAGVPGGPGVSNAFPAAGDETPIISLTQAPPADVGSFPAIASNVTGPGVSPFFPGSGAGGGGGGIPPVAGPGDPGVPTNPTDPGTPTNPTNPTDPTTPPVSAVPEPSSWAMMILGFLAVGGAMRRRAVRMRRPAGV